MGNSANCQTNCKQDCKTIGEYCRDPDVPEDKRPGGLEEVDISGLVNKPGGKDKELSEQGALGKYGPDGPSPNGKRPPFTVELLRTGQNWRTLGLLVSPDDDPRFLVVDDIWEPSLISDWNAAHSEMRVKPGDVIKSVNESTCGGEEMLAKIQALGKGTSLRLQIA